MVPEPLAVTLLERIALQTPPAATCGGESPRGALRVVTIASLTR